MVKRLLIVCAIISLISANLFAQYDMKAPLPLDPQVRTGKLANGLTYYVRHNAEPKERASFYIIQNVGAILENDDQDGLAHFLEHMAFNGTKHFPGRKGIVNMLEKHGVEFGRNINAYTAQDETVYNISDVPTTNEGLMDTCLLVLHDWSHYLILEGDEIDSERGVITEEWRTRRTPGFRIRAQVMPVLLEGSKYAERDVIGNLDIIKNFKYQTLRDYYHKWYRPDLQAIAVVGDFDVDRMEKKIIELFSQIPPVKDAAVREVYTVPAHEDIRYVCATDKEVTQSSVAVYIKFPTSPKEEKNHQYMRNELLKSFYNAMLSQRIRELLQKGNPPFINGSSGFSGMVRGTGIYIMSATAKPNEEALALEAIYRENERVKRFGFTEGELERVKTNTLVSLESALKQKDKISSESYIEEIKQNFLEGEPMVDFDYYYNFMKTIIPTVTVEEISALAQEYIKPQNMVIVVQGPSEGATHITKEEALAVMDKVDKSDIEPYKDQIAESSLINEELPGAKIVSVKKLPQFDAEEWTLANGAKVVYRKADYEKDQVVVTSYSKGGTSLYDLDKLASAQVTADLVGAYGLGDYDNITLGKLLTGKRAGSKVSIGSLSESVGGSSIPKDFETLMQLIYLRFEKPRFDKEVHNTLMQRQYAAIANMQKNPQKIMQDSIDLITSNYNPRTLLVNKEFFDRVSIEQIEEIYRDRIKDASDFIFFIVGNIDAEIAKTMAEKYIGSIKSYNRKETWRDNKVRGPKGKTEKVIEIALTTPKTTVITHHSKEMKYSVANNIYNNILKGILDLRYTENIREKEGGTYGVGVNAGSSREPYQSYSMTMNFDCDPDKAEHLKSLLYVEIDKLMKEGPTQEELDKVVTTMKKNREQGKEHNSYWLNALTTYFISGININDPKNFDKIVDSVKPKDIQNFAKKLFKGADVVDLMFVPKAQE
ncbi:MULTISPECIES: M16 family metallopeptidase [Porphyromonadaceae]|uniref:Peptidase M16 n=1 Tax=Sanguibacteroides justesenii TaxID=1547597 RepID=A0AB34R610_9PORP|nr:MULTISPECIES: M16 family metallopeptidase [Porphyromonadaceae]KIO46527.1 peptidase M16 [Sanguibacteroides justesenii]